jgi:hypothetical protein
MHSFDVKWRGELRSDRLAKPRRRICELRRSTRIRPSVDEPRMSHMGGRVFQILLLKGLEARLFLAKNWLKIGGSKMKDRLLEPGRAQNAVRPAAGAHQRKRQSL